MKKFKSLITAIFTIFFVLTAFEAKAEFKLFAKKEESAIKECRKLYEQKTKESWQKAYEVVCSELARNGNSEAQYYVGMMLKEANQLKDNKAMAYSFFYVANENGEKRAKSEMEGMDKVMSKREMERVYNSIGNIYNSSTTDPLMIKKDDRVSFNFLKKSASLGNKIAQSGLASTYALGISDTYKFPPNLIEAYKWSYLSIQDNIGFFPDSIKDLNLEKQTAKKVFEKIKSMCNKNQIQQGQKLAKEWIKNNPDLVNHNLINKNSSDSNIN